MVRFRVTVKRSIAVPGPAFERIVQAQSVRYAAACGLSLAGGGVAGTIEVTALRPAPGRPALTIFNQCSQGIYGFCYLSCVSPEVHEERRDDVLLR